MSREGLPEVPYNIDQELRRFLVAMRNAMVQVHQSVVPPAVPTNLIVTPYALGNKIEFTRSDASHYILYWNTIADLPTANPVDLANAATYDHNVGAAGQTRYYWIKGKKGDMESDPAGPAVGVTLASGAVIVPANPPPPSATPTTSNETDAIVSGKPGMAGYDAL